MYNIKWFVYATGAIDVLCSSVIFMSQNRPIIAMVQRIGRCPHIRSRSIVRSIDANMQNTTEVQSVLP